MKAVAKILGDPENDSLTAEEVAERVIEAYEEQRSKTHNLIVLGHFRLNETESYVAAVGPLSTRAAARARGVGERFAWDYKTRRGTGKFVLVPLVRNPNEAWDEARRDEAAEFTAVLNSITPGIEPSYEAMRLDIPDAVRASISANWQVDAETLEKKFGPHCLCGRYTFPERTHLGDPVTLGCPRHPEGEGVDRRS